MSAAIDLDFLLRVCFKDWMVGMIPGEKGDLPESSEAFLWDRAWRTAVTIHYFMDY